jgi:dienelactone hydrolase
LGLLRILVPIVLAASACGAGAAPIIRVTPADVVEGEPVHVIVEGLSPGEQIRLHASRRWSVYPTGEEPYQGSASFAADARGVVDLRTSPPLAGSSYDRADAAGLFWSMTLVRRTPAGVAVSGSKLTDPGTGPPGTVTIEAERAGAIIARADVRLRSGAGDVAMREVREPGVTGVFARNDDRGRQPAVIVLGGSEGGLFTARWAAPLIASRGYAVLGLGYFRGDEPELTALPSSLEHIPLETLERARDWLGRQPGVDASRIAVVGVSKGAEMTLVAAATYPWVTAVAAFAPSHVVWEGVPPDGQDRAAGSSWTRKGKPLPYVRWSRAAEERGRVTRMATGSSRLTETHLEALAEFASDVEQAAIPIDQSRAAVFVAAGTDDGMWPAAYSAEKLRQRLQQRDRSLAAVFEIHPTGHLVMGSGWGPTTQFQKTAGRLQGGNARLDAEAQKVIWPSFLSFLNTHLRRK